MKTKQEIAAYIASMNPSEYDALSSLLDYLVESTRDALLEEDAKLLKDVFGKEY